MKFSWIILASLLTSCAFSAPPLHHDKKPNPHSQDLNTKTAALENVAEEELTLRLEQIIAQAELELKEMEAKAEAFQEIHGTPNSNSLTLEKLLLLNKLQQTIKQENRESDITKLLLAQMLPLDSSLSPDQLLVLSRLSGGQDHRSSEQHDDDLLKKDFYDERNQDEMSLEQKVLEASLLQGLEMNHEQLLRLAELRAQRSGGSTLQELFLVHHRGASLTPEQILVLKSFTPSQILKYYYLLNDGSSSFGHGSLGSLINQFSDLAHTKVILENTELMLYNLLKNRNPHEGKLSLAELVVINRYQEAMIHSMRRTRFILMMHMMNMSNDMDSQDDDRTPQQQKMMLAAMIHRMTQQMNEKWDKEEALLLMRYRQGKATLEGTLMAYKRLDSMMNSGLGSDLRKIVMNELRTNMVKGSGIGMMRNGSWMNGWMNNMQWMNASDSDRINELWELYKLRFVRNFKSRDHERSRRRNFESKLSEIVLHEMDVKLGRQLFSMALNNLTDWSKEELSTLKGFNKTLAEDDYMAQQADVAEGERARTVLPAMPIYTNTVPTSQLPTYVNWTTTGWVGPIQNQGQCGSCWSFSAAGSLEAQYYNKTGTFVTMSEQNLIDCTYYLGNLGCSGGNVELAFDYVMTVGIDTYAYYPYTGRANNGVCKYNANNSVTQDVGWRLIPEGNELALQQAVALTGPVSVAIDASLPSFDSYAGGVYSPVMCSTTQLDHAVLVVGYGTYEGKNYWLIKNSWGIDWGIYGYMMMERGVNMCGIATAALFPVID